MNRCLPFVATFDCADGLPDGAKVTFDIVPNRGKESAENLRVQ